MNIKKLILLVGILANLTSFAQTFEWGYRTGGTDNDRSFDLMLDDAGNLYTAGIFRETVDFDPGPGVTNLTSNGDYDIFLRKTDPAGGLIWVKSIGGSAAEFPSQLAMDGTGNIYMAGIFQLTVDFDPGAGSFLQSSAGNYDGFVQKLDPNGNFVWATSFGSSGQDYALSIDVAPSDEVYVTGTFTNTIDLDPSTATMSVTSAGSFDIFVQKLTPAAGLVWGFSMGGSSLDRGTDIATDANGNVYLSGNFRSNMDFDPSLTSTSIMSPVGGTQDMFLMKMDSSSNLQWAGQYGGSSSNEDVQDLIVDDAGNIYSCGHIQGTGDIDPGPGVTTVTPVGSNDIYVQKVTTNGNLSWAKVFGGTVEDEGYGIAVDLLGDVYSIGYIQGQVDLDPGTGVFNLTGNGTGDAFVQKLDSSGNFVWAYEIGGSGFTLGEDVVVDQNGNVYATGEFTSQVDIDPGVATVTLASGGGYDGFLQKISQPGFCVPTYSSLSPVACLTYTTPSGNATYSVSGTYSDTLLNAKGCDSIVAINLTVNQATASSETVSSCNSYSWKGTSYTSSGTYNDTIMNAAGCDSVLTLNLTVNQATASSETVNACDSYSWQGTSYTSSGTYTDTLLNAAGCDSVLTLNLTVNQPTTSTETVSACDSYSWQGTSYTSSGTYNDTIMNAAGCDSVLTLNLTVNQATASVETVNACDSYSWQGMSYTSSGTYNDTIMNAAGCDSVLTLNLTVNQPTTSTETVSACNSYSWQGTSYTSSGTYNDTIMNAVGCDSVMTLNLTVVEVDTSITLTNDVLMAGQAGAVYQWYNCSTGSLVSGENSQSFTPIASGNYAVILDLNGCMDTSACVQVTVVGIEKGEFSDLLIYPNPNQGRFTIELGAYTSPVEVGIYDLQGQFLHGEILESSHQDLDLPMLAEGMYFVRLRIGEQQAVRKLWVRKGD